jgi:hypothetical protein
MMSLQHRMESALELWESMSDGIPDGHQVCHLIESFEDGLYENIEAATTEELS